MKTTKMAQDYSAESRAEVNPTWRLCKDELPDKPCECVCSDGERLFFARWFDDTPKGLSGWDINGLTNEPIAWLPIPQFPIQSLR